MRPRHWTIQVMPEGCGRVRTFILSHRVLRLGAVIAAAFVLLAVGFAITLGIGSAREAELARLRSENRLLSANLGEMEQQVTALGTSIDVLTARDQRLRLLAGLPSIDPEIRAVGIGGPEQISPDQDAFFALSPDLAERTYSASYDVNKLTRRMDLLSSSLTEAIDSMAIREEVFLATPSINPVVGESWLSSGFSRSRYHPILHVSRPHLGVDISAARGATVIATANGRVTYAGNRLGYGKVIEIDHGHGYRTRFAHVQNITVRRGQQIKRGEVIGEVGRTGLATGPNLHYEVLANDRRVNPANYILVDGGTL